MSTINIDGLLQPALQLWCVRDALSHDLSATCADLRDAGFCEVEPFAPADFPGLGAALRTHGLRADSVHEHLIGADLAEAFAVAHSVGAGLVIESWTEPGLWRRSASVVRLADALNRVALAAAEHGLRVGYHNHDHEFATRIGDEPAFFAFADALAPEVVLQIDLATVRQAGVDPGQVWRRYGDRVESVHVLGEPGATTTLTTEPDGELGDELAALPPLARVIIEVEDGPFPVLAEARSALQQLAVAW